MKKILNLFIATTLLSTTGVWADQYPCQSAYEAKLSHLHGDYIDTLARSFRSKNKVVGGFNGLRYSQLSIEGLDNPKSDTSIGISLGVFLGGSGGFLGGAFIGSGIAELPAAQATALGFGVGAPIALFASYMMLADTNMDFKELTHPQSTARFVAYVKTLAAQDVFTEIYQGRAQLISKYKERTINIKELNDANDKKLAKINKLRFSQGLPILTMSEAFPEEYGLTITEVVPDEKIKSALDGLHEYISDEFGDTTYTTEELASLIKKHAQNEPDLFCKNGQPAKFAEIFKILKKKIKKSS